MIMGLDLSLTSTGLVVLDKHGRLLYDCTVSTGPKDPWHVRCRDIASVVDHQIYKLGVTEVWVEGYGFSSNNLAPSVELGTVVRLTLLDALGKYGVVTPTQVKKFASGKGNTPKAMIPMHVLDRWGYKALNDDLADAYVVAMIGLEVQRYMRDGFYNGLIVPQIDVLKQVVSSVSSGGKQPKK